MLAAQSGGTLQFMFVNSLDVLTPYAREVMVRDALKMGVDEILWIDDDQVVPVNIYEHLKATMERENADIVAALTHTRKWPHFPVFYRNNLNLPTMTRQNGNVEEIRISFTEDIDYKAGEVAEYDAVGFGCVLMKTGFLAKMQPPFFMSTTAAGEDIYFCWKAQNAGAKIVGDATIEVAHLGDPKMITRDTWMREGYAKMKAERLKKEAEEAAKKEVPNAVAS